jgi:hypothetical protein
MAERWRGRALPYSAVESGRLGREPIEAPAECQRECTSGTWAQHAVDSIGVHHQRKSAETPVVRKNFVRPWIGRLVKGDPAASSVSRYIPPFDARC